ncbi:Uncharacterised protein [Streptococcus equi subsp. equi]|nr:Uncharacterised protein [Streptococcus equi subsp. equi]
MSEGAGIERLKRPFSAILLNKLPVVLKSSIFKRLLVKWFHDVTTYLLESSIDVLDNVKTIENDFSLRK